MRAWIECRGKAAVMRGRSQRPDVHAQLVRQAFKRQSLVRSLPSECLNALEDDGGRQSPSRIPRTERLDGDIKRRRAFRLR